MREPQVSAALALLLTACSETAAQTASLDAGRDIDPVAVAEAGNPDAGGDGADSVECMPLGTGALAVLGCPCATPGGLSCAGNTQPDVLVCQRGAWAARSTCPGGQVCNSIPGPRQGTCATVVPQCISQPTGQILCLDRWTLGVCSADMLLASIRPCGGGQCVAGACSDALMSD
jgi:hypothetical protein